MFEFLKKAAPQTVVAAAQTVAQMVRGENYTVEQIHNDFDTAAQRAVEEANKILGQFANADTQKQVANLVKAGFNNVPIVVKWMEDSQKRSEAQQKVDIVNKYQGKYPNHKFIFMEQVKEICQKYGLLCAPVGKYKGTVPAKNLEEIANFRVADADKYLEEGNRWRDRIEFDFSRRNNFRTKEQYDKLCAEYSQRRMDAHRMAMLGDDRMMRASYGYDQVPYHAEVPLFICAPKGDIIINKDDKISDEVFVGKEIKDPIVLHYVGDGFLVVTKWGPEAEDPALVNEKMN